MSWIMLVLTIELLAFAAFLLHVWKKKALKRGEATSTPLGTGVKIPAALVKEEPPTLRHVAIGEEAYIGPHGIVVDSDGRAYVNTFTRTRPEPSESSLRVVRIEKGFRVYLKPSQKSSPIFERQSIANFGDVYRPVLEVIWEEGYDGY